MSGDGNSEKPKRKDHALNRRNMLLGGNARCRIRDRIEQSRRGCASTTARGSIGTQAKHSHDHGRRHRLVQHQRL